VPVPGDRAAAADNPSLNVEVRPRNFFTPPMAQQVQANFGDEIMLLGYDFPERRAEPGAALPITLYWQALKPIGRPYVVSNHLLHQADLRQWGGADRIPLYYYSPMLWAPGEIVRDEYLVPVDPSAPPGVYALDIGLYLELAGQTRHVPLVRDEQVLEANSVSIAPIKVGGPPPGVTVQDPQPQYRRAENLGDFITFLGYDVQVEADALDLVLFWRCDQVLPADYTTFVHVRYAGGRTTGGKLSDLAVVARRSDSRPGPGTFPLLPITGHV
jgi:hypothetical protein